MKTNQPVTPVNENSALQTLFYEQLQDIYWAEKDLVKNLKKLAGAATSEELKTVFESHRTETEGQVKRLEEVFVAVGEKAKAKKCVAMAGLAEEADELIKDTEKGSMVRDVALIAGAQKVEHYEIASYGTLAALAGILGHKEAQKLLSQTLEEEKKADTVLSGIAEGFVNASSLQEEK